MFSVHKLIGHLKFTRYYFIWRTGCMGMSLLFIYQVLQSGEQINQNRQSPAEKENESKCTKI